MSKEEEELEEIIESEYKIWKKNTSFLYEIVISHTLTWPSGTVQWIPTERKDKSLTQKRQRMILGTSSNNQDEDILFVTEVTLPVIDNSTNVQLSVPKVEMVRKFPHLGGDVCRARAMPNQHNIIATKSHDGRVDIFDISAKLSDIDQKNAEISNDSESSSDDDKSFGLSWNPIKIGEIGSCGEDGNLFIWNLREHLPKAQEFITKKKSSYQKEDSRLNLTCTSKFNYKNSKFFTGKKGVTPSLEDVSFNFVNENILGCVTDDKKILLFDSRVELSPFSVWKGHEAEIYSIEFHPNKEYLFASGSQDTLIHLWDMRKSGEPVATLEGHTKDVVCVRWSPINETMIASGGSDRRVIVWDVSKIGEGQMAEEAEDGPPEMLFIHSGHRSTVSDLSWNPDKDDSWTIASVEENNCLQVWKMIDSVYKDLESLVKDDELE